MLQAYDERNRDLIVYINGALVHRDEAGVSPFDSAVQNGDAVCRVRTSTTRACPTGITRATILELCRKHDIPHEIADIPAREIPEADEVFCTGTMGEVIPVTRIDMTTYQAGHCGPVTARLAELYRELTETDGTALV